MMGNSESKSSNNMDEKVASTSVLMYSTTTCHHCDNAKKFFKQNRIAYESVELDQMPPRERNDAANALLERTNRRTVPQIFICGEHIGGFSELMQLHFGAQLMEKVHSCPMLHPLQKHN